MVSGVEGIDGEDVPEKLSIDELTRRGFKCGNVTTVRRKSDYSVEHKFCGAPAIQGKDGGDGGCGGSGGRSGKVQLFGLTNQSNIVVSQQNGKKELITQCFFARVMHARIHISLGARGMDGKGGMGGREARNGLNYHIRILYVSH